MEYYYKIKMTEPTALVDGTFPTIKNRYKNQRSFYSNLTPCLMDRIQLHPCNVDICLVLDCSGSMGRWISLCKENLDRIVETVQKDFS